MGLAARPGGRPDRLRTSHPRGRLRLPDLPRTRRRLVPRGRPDQPAGHVPRCEQRRLGPQHQQLPALHDRHRLPDAARHRLRDGHRQGRRGQRGHRLLRRRREQPGRRGRVLHLLRGLQRPGRVLLPEQPVGDLRAHREADPGAALPARPGLRLPRCARGRQRRAGLSRGHQVGPGARPQRRGPHPGRGVHLPHGRPHHLRRPDQVPGRRGARGLGGEGPDPAPSPVPGDLKPRGRGILRGTRGRERGVGQAST